jgi:hypothetical protein
MEPVKINGKMVTFDLSKVSHAEYQHFWKPDATPEQESAFFVKVCGLTAEQIDALPETEWRKFKQAFSAACLESVETAEKNSQGGST